MIIDKNTPPSVKGEFLFDMQSVVCEDIKSKALNKKFIDHLKSEDFFFVEKFPAAEIQIQGVDFSINSFQKKSDGTFEYVSQEYRPTSTSKQISSDAVKDLHKIFDSLESAGYKFFTQGIARAKVSFKGKTKQIKFPISLFSLSKPRKSYITEEYDGHDTVMTGGFALSKKELGINYMSVASDKKNYIKDLVDISFVLYSMGIEPDYFFFNPDLLKKPPKK